MGAPGWHTLRAPIRDTPSVCEGDGRRPLYNHPAEVWRLVNAARSTQFTEINF